MFKIKKITGWLKKNYDTIGLIVIFVVIAVVFFKFLWFFWNLTPGV